MNVHFQQCFNCFLCIMSKKKRRRPKGAGGGYIIDISFFCLVTHSPPLSRSRNSYALTGSVTRLRMSAPCRQRDAARLRPRAVPGGDAARKSAAQSADGGLNLSLLFYFSFNIYRHQKNY